MEGLKQNIGYGYGFEISFDGPNEVPGVSAVYRIVKRTMDVVCSALAILLLSPLLLLVGAAIRLTSAGPAVYKQQRMGYGGKPFTIYKFRTMFAGADNLREFLPDDLLKVYAVNRKLANDPRITPLGRALRATSMDELPQLFNILNGEMSIVGPRPMLWDEIGMYGENYKQYITVKPGLTGLWQIKSRNKTTMPERARLDLEYIQNKSLAYDNVILLKTVKAVLTRKGAY